MDLCHYDPAHSTFRKETENKFIYKAFRGATWKSCVVGSPLLVFQLRSVNSAKLCFPRHLTPGLSRLCCDDTKLSDTPRNLSKLLKLSIGGWLKVFSRDGNSEESLEALLKFKLIFFPPFSVPVSRNWRNDKPNFALQGLPWRDGL